MNSGSGNNILKYLWVFLFALSSCSTFQLSLRPHVGSDYPEHRNVGMDYPEPQRSIVEEENCDCPEKAVQCEECKVVPQSGQMRDLRVGYYYDPKEKKCKRVSYSSGGVPAPFKTMEECRSCCCKLLLNF